MTHLVFSLPDKETPGFLRRSKAAFEFQNKLKADTIDSKVIDDIVTFLLPFIKEPVDRLEAAETLWDASQAQFEELMSALVGQTNPTKAENSPSSTPPA